MADYQPSRGERESARESSEFQRERAALARAQRAQLESTYNIMGKMRYFAIRKSPYIKFFFFLLILGLIGVATYGFFQTGVGQSYYEKTTVALSESTFGQTIVAWYSEVLMLTNPQAFAFQNPQAAEIKPEQPIGITIKTLTSRKTLYSQDQPIELIGSVEVQGIDRDVDLKFKCEMDSYDNSKSVVRIPNEDKKGNIVETRIEKDQSRIIPIECNFPIEGRYQNFSDEEDSERILFTKKVTLGVIYNVDTKPTELKVYTLPKSKLDEILLKNIDPFDFYRLKEALRKEGVLAGEGVIRAKYYQAPEILSVSLVTKQPVSLGSYPIIITLKNDQVRWHGELDRVNSLKIVLDNGMNVNVEECPNFDASGDLKSKVIEALNNYDCTKSSLDLATLKKEDVEDCLDIYNRDEIILHCEVEIKELAKPADIGILFLKLIANYDYKVKKTTTVDIRKRTKAEETLKGAAKTI